MVLDMHTWPGVTGAPFSVKNFTMVPVASACIHQGSLSLQMLISFSEGEEHEEHEKVLLSGSHGFSPATMKDGIKVFQCPFKALQQRRAEPEHTSISFMSFIASMMQMVWPLTTLSPSFTNAGSPGAGARYKVPAMGDATCTDPLQHVHHL